MEGELNNPLTYLSVIGETGHPGLEKVRVRVYLAPPEEEAAIRCLWHGMLATSPRHRPELSPGLARCRAPAWGRLSSNRHA